MKVNKENIISDFIEHPKTFVSDLAIIGIYYFREGLRLKQELKNLIDSKLQVNGEYQLTVALENMKNKGVQFIPGNVLEWLDCGTKNATVYTNQRILESLKDENLIAESAAIKNSIITDPCYIGENVVIENSIIGPHISIGNNTKISNSLLKNSIIQSNSVIQNLNIQNSMVGNYVNFTGDISEVNIGDFTQIST